LIALIVLGRFLERRAKHRTGDALRSIRALQAPTALLGSDNDDESAEEIHVSLVEVGDLLRVLPGARVPVDGVVVRGSTTVDEAMVTGEARPVVKQIDSALIGGTSNIDGFVLMRAVHRADESMVAHIAALMSDAQATKPQIQLLADRIAVRFVPIVVALALAVFGIWLSLTGSGFVAVDDRSAHWAVFSARFAIALLVVSCPCAVALAAPTVVVVACGIAAQHGLLLKNGASIEQLHRVTDVFFDKTGTVTVGKPQLVGVHAVGIKKRRLLNIVAACESGSEHALARGIVDGCRTQLANEAKAVGVRSFRAVPGGGVVCEIDDDEKTLVIGTPQLLLAEAQIELSDEQLNCLDKSINTVVYVALGGRFVGALALADVVRDEAASVVRWLGERHNIAVWLVSGDDQQATSAVAAAVGIDAVRAIGRASPANKAERVKQLQATGRIVMHVGDGVNDAVALTQANVGCAMASSTDVAASAADVVLLKDDLRDIVCLLALARSAVWRIRINLAWAFVYNLAAMPLAAGAFYPLGSVSIPPAWAGASELLSSLPVLLASLLLYRFKPPTIVSKR
jgi:P-type Cu+ transporter